MANTFNLGNGSWAQKTEKLLAYNAENDNYKPLPFDFDRASTATRVNRDGLIETVATDEPRIDFLNNTNGHLLLEPSRQNIITYSEFDSANPNNWQTGFGTGTFSYDLVSYKSRPALKQRQQTEGRSYKAQNVTVSTSTTYTLSFYIDKANSINIDDSDIVCAIISSDDIGFSSRNYGDADENNRINFTFTTDVDTSIQIRIGLGASGNQSGDKTLIFSMPQLETGSYATSYIPTSGSAVTRSAETCNGAGNSTVFNDSEGVLYAEIGALDDDLTFRVLSVSDGSNNNTVKFGYRSDSNRIYAEIRSGGSSQAFLSYDVTDITDFNKVALKYKLNDFALWVNGTERATDTSGNTPIGLSKLSLDRGDGGNDFYGKVKDVRVYNTALTDAELIALTSG